jgi:phosphotransferase system HPr-like phosphotransfer protein
LGDTWVNAKNMMEILELGAGPGETLTLETNGSDSDTTLNELVRFFDTEAKTL